MTRPKPNHVMQTKELQHLLLPFLPQTLEYPPRTKLWFLNLSVKDAINQNQSA